MFWLWYTHPPVCRSRQTGRTWLSRYCSHPFFLATFLRATSLHTLATLKHGAFTCISLALVLNTKPWPPPNRLFVVGFTLVSKRPRKKKKTRNVTPAAPVSCLVVSTVTDTRHNQPVVSCARGRDISTWPSLTTRYWECWFDQFAGCPDYELTCMGNGNTAGSSSSSSSPLSSSARGNGVVEEAASQENGVAGRAPSRARAVAVASGLAGIVVATGALLVL